MEIYFRVLIFLNTMSIFHRSCLLENGIAKSLCHRQYKNADEIVVIKDEGEEHVTCARSQGMI